MNRNRTALAASIFAAFLATPLGMLSTPKHYRPARFYRSAEERARRLAAAEAKRARRRARNLALLRAEQARKAQA